MGDDRRADSTDGSGMMQIGELAERTSLSLRTIRHYDEIGLLTPSGRTEGGFRLYTDDDFDRLMLIRRMKPLGYSLDEMGDLLRAIDADPADPTADLSSFIDEATSRRATLAERVAMADEFLELLRSRQR